MEKLTPIPSPPGTAFREFRIRFLPCFVFLSVLAATIWMWRGYVVTPVVMVGEVVTSRSTISAPISGRLSQFPVVAFQRVKGGQIVAQITPAEPAVMDAQVALAKARIDQIRSNFDPFLRRQNSEINYAGLRLNWLEHRIALAGAIARTNFLAGELDRAKRFQSGIGNTGIVNRPADASGGFASLADVQRAQAALDDALFTIVERQKAIGEIGLLLDRLLPEELRIDDEIPSGVRAAILVEERNLQVLESQMAPQSILATMDGVITAIQRRAGEHVLTGESLLTITAEKGEAIVSYWRAPLNEEVRVGRPMEIRTLHKIPHIARTSITDVGPSLEPIPVNLHLTRQLSNMPIELGLLVRLPVPPELNLRPGELVSLTPMN